MGKIEALLKSKLENKLGPTHLEILNESPQHGLPKEAEKHFRVIAVSLEFTDRSRVERHRLVHDIVAEELRTHVHALSVQAFTPEEWSAKQGRTFESPECLGGGKRHGMK
jgi:BolA protein